MKPFHSWVMLSDTGPPTGAAYTCHFSPLPSFFIYPRLACTRVHAWMHAKRTPIWGMTSGVWKRRRRRKKSSSRAWLLPGNGRRFITSSGSLQLTLARTYINRIRLREMLFSYNLMACKSLTYLLIYSDLVHGGFLEEERFFPPSPDFRRGFGRSH